MDFDRMSETSTDSQSDGMPRNISEETLNALLPKNYMNASFHNVVQVIGNMKIQVHHLEEKPYFKQYRVKDFFNKMEKCIKSGKPDSLMECKEMTVIGGKYLIEDQSKKYQVAIKQASETFDSDGTYIYFPTSLVFDFDVDFAYQKDKIKKEQITYFESKIEKFAHVAMQCIYEACCKHMMIPYNEPSSSNDIDMRNIIIYSAWKDLPIKDSPKKDKLVLGLHVHVANIALNTVERRIIFDEAKLIAKQRTDFTKLFVSEGGFEFASIDEKVFDGATIYKGDSLEYTYGNGVVLPGMSKIKNNSSTAYKIRLCMKNSIIKPVEEMTLEMAFDCMKNAPALRYIAAITLQNLLKNKIKTKKFNLTQITEKDVQTLIEFPKVMRELDRDKQIETLQELEMNLGNTPLNYVSKHSAMQQLIMQNNRFIPSNEVSIYVEKFTMMKLYDFFTHILILPKYSIEQYEWWRNIAAAANMIKETTSNITQQQRMVEALIPMIDTYSRRAEFVDFEIPDEPSKASSVVLEKMKIRDDTRQNKYGGIESVRKEINKCMKYENTSKWKVATIKTRTRQIQKETPNLEKDYNKRSAFAIMMKIANGDFSKTESHVCGLLINALKPGKYLSTGVAKELDIFVHNECEGRFKSSNNGDHVRKYIRDDIDDAIEVLEIVKKAIFEIKKKKHDFELDEFDETESIVSDLSTDFESARRSGDKEKTPGATEAKNIQMWQQIFNNNAYLSGTEIWFKDVLHHTDVPFDTNQRTTLYARDPDNPTEPNLLEIAWPKKRTHYRLSEHKPLFRKRQVNPEIDLLSRSMGAHLCLDNMICKSVPLDKKIHERSDDAMGSFYEMPGYYEKRRSDEIKKITNEVERKHIEKCHKDIKLTREYFCSMSGYIPLDKFLPDVRHFILDENGNLLKKRTTHPDVDQLRICDSQLNKKIDPNITEDKYNKDIQEKKEELSILKSSIRDLKAQIYTESEADYEDNKLKLLEQKMEQMTINKSKGYESWKRSMKNWSMMVTLYIGKRRAYAEQSEERYEWLIGSMCFWMVHNIRYDRSEIYTELIDKGLGSAGKSFFQRVIHSVLENGKNTFTYAYKSDKDVLKKFMDASKGNDHLCAVGQRGLRFFTIEEGQYPDGASGIVLKTLTSGSRGSDTATTQGRKVGGNNNPLYFHAAFVVYANRPIQYKIDEVDEALKRRRRIVECEQRFLVPNKPRFLANGEKIDPEPFGFYENNQREWNLQPWAVLSFVVQSVLGSPRIWYYSCTQELPEFLAERSTKILQNVDPINNFFKTALSYVPDSSIDESNLYQHYKEWWTMNHSSNEKVSKPVDFIRHIEMYLNKELPQDPDTKKKVLHDYATIVIE